MKKVSQRKAPGAMSAMAFIVKPVKPNVGFISTDASAMFMFFSSGILYESCGRNVLAASTWMLLLNLPAAAARGDRGTHLRRGRTQKLERTGLKTIVVMAGGCALPSQSASSAAAGPGGCTTETPSATRPS